MNKQFASVFTIEDKSNIPLLESSPHPDIPDINISEEGVLKQLRQLNPRKASGPDGIPARLLKEMAVELTPMLTMIFQASIHQSTVPDDWNKALVIPAYKRGDKSNPANYHLISLTCVACKILEYIISSNIYTHLSVNNIFHDSQHGFCKRSCELQLINIVNDFATALNDRHEVDAIFFDMSKAFDTVPHIRLFHKSSYYGMHNSTLEIGFRGFLPIEHNVLL